MKSEYERWESKVIFSKDNETCWEWKGSKYRKGYGHFRGKKNGKWIMQKAHRFSYQYHNNISKEEMQGKQVCHTCDNPSCVNPKHLFLGTTQDNTNDKISKGRHSFGNNPEHRLLSFQIAQDIRRFKIKNPKVIYKDIAKVYGTSTQQVCRILNNQIWKEN